MKEKRTQAQKLGGVHRRKKKPHTDTLHKITKYQDIQRLLEVTINDVCGWEDSEKRIQAISRLSKLAIDLQPLVKWEKDHEIRY
jgi:hypothetical protein